MNMPDFTNYDDEKLDAARVALQTEVEKRQRRNAIPGQVQALAAAYVQDGGDLGDLTLEQPVTPDPVVPEPEPTPEPEAGAEPTDA